MDFACSCSITRLKDRSDRVLRSRQKLIPRGAGDLGGVEKKKKSHRSVPFFIIACTASIRRSIAIFPQSNCGGEGRLRRETWWFSLAWGDVRKTRGSTALNASRCGKKSDGRVRGDPGRARNRSQKGWGPCCATKKGTSRKNTRIRGGGVEKKSGAGGRHFIGRRKIRLN